MSTIKIKHSLAERTLPLLSIQPTVCFIQCTSSRSLKSSRACAPRDSLRASAPYLQSAILIAI